MKLLRCHALRCDIPTIKNSRRKLHGIKRVAEPLTNRPQVKPECNYRIVTFCLSRSPFSSLKQFPIFTSACSQATQKNDSAKKHVLLRHFFFRLLFSFFLLARFVSSYSKNDITNQLPEICHHFPLFTF